jgi:hypothetical protein
MDDMKNSSELVYKILEQTQLENFWPKIRDDLQILRLSHFDFVKVKDFQRIGLSKPAIRRLLDHVKKVQDNLNLQRNSVTKRQFIIFPNIQSDLNKKAMILWKQTNRPLKYSLMLAPVACLEISFDLILDCAKTRLSKLYKHIKTPANCYCHFNSIVSPLFFL